ncbi:glutamate-cysteine ligase family protein [Actinoplanes sp. NPDC049118]|uniref:glutamate-cysteine ligase family protein n=1 Tax=Actinoplanes sp. NPDC049118 TaxID=3155769 RepID=UPI0033CCB5D6
MISLTEPAAERLVADQAFTPGMPGFVGVAVDLLLDRPALPGTPPGSPAERPRLRHGFLTAGSARVAVVSGPPSPGVEASAARMTEDLRTALPLIGVHRAAVLDEAADAVDPQTAGDDAYATATAGIRVGLEAGIDGAGPYGLGRRWHLAHAIAPVLAAAFANAPLHHGRPTGWRSVRQALRRDLPSAPPGDDPRAAWTALVLDSPSGGRTFREWTRSAPGDRPTGTDLARHIATLRPPVAARRHLEIDVADRQPGDGWLVPLAVTAALLDDAYAAAEAECATRPLVGTPRLWERAARDALTDPDLATAARECFVSAYAALARQGVSREIRDAVAAFTERYVLRGRCPADDVLDRVTARP